MPSAAPENEPRIVDLGAALSERYLAYALSTITSRSLPDVRDGLKPVQRRLLYAMLQLRLDPAGGFKKCARVVGDVIGKYHPHGDASVYDALVRLAQVFAQRYPLVDGQGNFGNIDGDNAAAMRYTESRLTAVATALLDGITEDAVDFRPTYDGSEDEPVVLPAAFPNLLANGATGIAVGMATSIPPHNAGELLSALVWMAGRPLGAPSPKTEQLLEHVKGPDLPTGGILIEADAARLEAYASGRGSFRLRARWVRENLVQGQYQIVVTEIPWQVAKGRLIERIAELLAQKKLTLLADVRDESAEEVRLVLIPRSRTVPDELLMEQLFRATDLEVRLGLNMNVLDAAGVPRVMGLGEVLAAFMAHRLEILLRRRRHRLARVDDRLEVLEGYLKAFLDIDEVIRIIREEDEAKPALIARFELSERQAEAILNLRLRNLRRLEEFELQREHEKLLTEKAEIEALLADPARQRARLKDEFREARKAFGKGKLGDRRTGFAAAPDLAPAMLEEPVERYPVTIVCSRQNWIRTVRGNAGSPGELKYKEGDAERYVIAAQSTDKLLLLTSEGRCFTLGVDRLPTGRGLGEPLSLIVDLGGAVVVALLVHRPDGRLVLGSGRGMGFLAPEAELLAQTRAGRQVMTLSEGDRLAVARPAMGDRVAVLLSDRRLLVFAEAELPVQARGKGVQLARMKDATLLDLLPLPREGLLAVRVGLDKPRSPASLVGFIGKRAGVGKALPIGWGKVTGLVPAG